MTTLEKIEFEGQGAIDALRRGETLTADQEQVLKIYNILHAKKAGNAGKRINREQKQRVR